MYLTYVKFLFAVSSISFVIAQNDDLQSPCPGLFVYEAKSKEPNTWYGIVTMLSDEDTIGVWLSLLFDKHPLQVGNWYGAVLALNETNYEISNLKERLKANVPKTIRFFVKYDPAEPPPRLTGFLLNANKLCPGNEVVPETSTTSLLIERFGDSETTPSPVNESVRDQEKPSVNRPYDVSEDDEFFKGDIYQFLQPKEPAGNDSSDICGTVVASSKPTADGELTNEGEFPWHGAIYYLKENDTTYICGATLISKNFVITVAHCVTKVGTSKLLKPEKLIVYLGKHYLKRFSNEGIQERPISEIISHPDYNPQNYSNDIALLKLLLPAEYSNYVRPACLWQESIDLSAILGTQGDVIGWGFDKTGKVSEQLMSTAMPIVSYQACISSDPDFYARFVSPNSYCAVFGNATTVCNGDSGSGMFFPKTNSSFKNPVWQLRGLVSISAALHVNFKCDSSNYVVFADIAKYLDWIKNIIK